MPAISPGAPEGERSALCHACAVLAMEAAQTCFHQLLQGLGGWAHLARQRLWQAELSSGVDPITTDMLTIRILWAQALLTRYAPKIADEWAQIALAVLQEAAKRAAQRALAPQLSGAAVKLQHARPSLQTAFCIDVRSEVFRRALEGLARQSRRSALPDFSA